MLYIIATPIGNLEDITLRALRVLKEVDLILAEDTRVTRKLLDHFKISIPLESFHEHTDKNKLERILNMLEEGKNIALVSDAGTPGISDPGPVLVSKVREILPNVQIIGVPGASALATALSVSGIQADEFLFLGFPPHKKGRQTFFKKVIESEYPVVFYESPHRIVKALEMLNELGNPSTTPQSGGYGARKVFIARELTKKFETLYSGTAEEVLEKIKQNPKGEFVVVVCPERS